MSHPSMLPIGVVLQGKYRIESFLASGGFGNTYRATHITLSKTVAVKEFFMKGVNHRGNDALTVLVSNADNKSIFNEQRRKFQKEAQRISGLNDPHIVTVSDLFEENGTTYYVMDYINGESLSAKLKAMGQPFTEKLTIKVLGQLLSALDTIHQRSIWHMDIKPGNILMDSNGDCVLIDFGSSKQSNRGEGATTSTAMSYTPGYAAPEQVNGQTKKWGPWTDFYALGATIYNLLTTEKPPLSSDIIDDRQEAFNFPKYLSRNITTLVEWMMQPSVKSRPQRTQAIRSYLHNVGLDRIEDQPKRKGTLGAATPLAEGAAALDDVIVENEMEATMAEDDNMPVVEPSEEYASLDNDETMVEEDDPAFATEYGKGEDTPPSGTEQKEMDEQPSDEKQPADSATEDESMHSEEEPADEQQGSDSDIQTTEEPLAGDVAEHDTDDEDRETDDEDKSTDDEDQLADDEVDDEIHEYEVPKPKQRKSAGTKFIIFLTVAAMLTAAFFVGRAVYLSNQKQDDAFPFVPADSLVEVTDKPNPESNKTQETTKPTTTTPQAETATATSQKEAATQHASQGNDRNQSRNNRETAKTKTEPTKREANKIEASNNSNRQSSNDNRASSRTNSNPASNANTSSRTNRNSNSAPSTNISVNTPASSPSTPSSRPSPSTQSTRQSNRSGQVSNNDLLNDASKNDFSNKELLN